jgi:hypothetical protein
MRDFNKRKYFLTAESFFLSPEEKEEYLQYSDGFNSREEAEVELEWLVKKYSMLGDNVKLNRVVFLENPEDLDSSNLGEHWTDEDIDDVHIDKIRETMDSVGEPYIIEAYFKKEDIDN